MDDIVWSIKPSNDSMQKIAARMREFATNVLEAKEIELDFKVDDKVYDEKLDMEARRDFFLVFKEVVNNAAKYSKAVMASSLVTPLTKQSIDKRFHSHVNAKRSAIKFGRKPGSTGSKNILR